MSNQSPETPPRPLPGQNEPAQSPLPRPRSGPLTAVMMAIGIILLLPGLCTLFFAGSMVINDAAGVIRDIRRGDPIIQMVLMGILISLFGIWLLRQARR